MKMIYLIRYTATQIEEMKLKPMIGYPRVLWNTCFKAPLTKRLLRIRKMHSTVLIQYVAALNLSQLSITSLSE